MRENVYKSQSIGDEKRITDSLARRLTKEIYGSRYQFLTNDALKRISEVNQFYDYYDLGDASMGTGQYWTTPRLDYEPTVMPVNLARWFINKRTAWLFENAPDIECPPEQIDKPEKMESVDYVPSKRQKKSNESAAERQRFLYKLWTENSFEEKLLEGARDYLIGGTVACKLRLLPSGLRYQFAPAQEIFPIPDEDEPEKFSAIHFASFYDDDKTIWRQTWRLENKKCYLSEATYDLHLNEKDVKYNNEDTGLDFIPVLLFPREKLTGNLFGTSYLKDLIPILDQYNRLMSDAADALRFNMFAINILLNPAPGAAKKAKFSPGEVWELYGDEVDAKKLESSFQYSNALNEFLTRLENVLHLIGEVPDVTPERIKGFGLVSGVALKLLYSDLVSATMRDWRVWKSRLVKMNEYSLRILQKFPGNYDTSSIDDFTNRVICHLPLPENEAEKISVEVQKLVNSLQSVEGAMEEIGVKFPEKLIAEIISERERFLDTGVGKEIDIKERGMISGA